MKIYALILFGLSCCAIAAAQEAPAADLLKRAEQAHGQDCVHLSLDASHQALEFANRLFTDGSPGGHRWIDSSVHYARHAVDCSIESRKSEKNAEIDLRKLIRRMKDVEQSLDSEDRPRVHAAVAELDRQRDRLLFALFGSAATHKEANP